MKFKKKNSALNIKYFPVFLFIIMTLVLLSCNSQKRHDFQRDINFNNGWKFTRLDSTQNEEKFQSIKYNDNSWESIHLPHTAFVEPLIVNDQWQGICWYRKKFALMPEHEDKIIQIEFEGAMQVAEVWLNDQFLLKHEGGYLPFTIDLTDKVFYDKDNIIAVRLDNRDNPEIPPDPDAFPARSKWPFPMSISSSRSPCRRQRRYSCRSPR